MSSVGEWKSMFFQGSFGTLNHCFEKGRRVPQYGAMPEAMWIPTVWTVMGKDLI
jgi:hypothetical protein